MVLARCSHPHLGSLVLTASVLGFPPSTSAQGEVERPTFRIERIPANVTRPSLDGVLDDAAWQRVEPLPALRQVEPVELGEPSQPTDVRLTYDSAAIYLGVMCYDTGELRATLRERDADLRPDDRIVFILDPTQDGVSAYGFQVGAGGARADAGVHSGGRANPNVDYRWSAVTRITAEGWVAEIEIPWSNFNFDPERGSWGFNIQRVIKRNGETIRWASPTPSVQAFSPKDAGTLEGLENLESALDLEVKPFVLGDYSLDRGLDDEDTELDAGVDLFYKLTPDTKLTLSVNTDFAETEVDDRYVNLTRFPLFYTEKRDFFLEDEGIFNFGAPFRPGAIDVLPYHSRRIGLDAMREEVPILFAGKVTAETPGYRYGLMGVRTDEKGMLSEQSLAVGRFSKNLWKASDIGVLVTGGDPLDRNREYTAGADFNYRTTEFNGDDNLNVTAFFLTTETEGISDHQNSYQLLVDYPNDEVEVFASYTVIEKNFDAAIGFTPRTGVKKYQSAFAYQPRVHTDIRQLEFRVEPSLITDTGGDKETVDVLVRPLGIHFESGDSIQLDLEHNEEVLTLPFLIVPGVMVPVGDYEFLRYGVRFESSGRRPLEAILEAFFGEFFDGDREDYTLGFTWRPGLLGSLGVEWEHNDIDLPGGAFDVDIFRVRGNVQFNDELVWKNYVQWDDQSDLIGLNSRLRWFLEDGRELNFVLNQGWNYDTETFSPDDTNITLKVSYNFRF